MHAPGGGQWAHSDGLHAHEGAAPHDWMATVAGAWCGPKFFRGEAIATVGLRERT